MRPILKGSTDQSVIIRIVDSADGTPETGVVYNTSGIDLWYRREGATKTSITEATLTNLNDAHSDGGVLHIGDGYYRLDLPDAAVASGANGVAVGGTVTGMVVIGCYAPLVNYDPYDGVRMGLTALPNAAAEAAGGLYTRGTGAGQINQAANGQIDANSIALSGDSGAADNAEAFFDGTGYAGTNNVIPTVTTLTNLPAITANWLTAAGIADGAIDTATFATGTTIPRCTLTDTVTTYTGNTPQTGDVYALANGVAGFVALKADTAATLVDTNELQTDWANGGRLDLILDARASQTSVDTIDGIVDSILVDTAEIGAAGAGLTALASAANLATAVGYIDTEVASILAAVDTEIAAIYSRIGAPAGASIAADIAAISAGSAPSAATVADAVWDELLSGHATSGSAGALLSAAGVASDPWAAASRTLTSTGTVNVVGPVAVGGAAEIVQGDTHTAAAAGVLDWSSTDWPDLTTATIALRLSKRGKATYVWGKAGTVVNGGAATQTARFELTAAETLALDSGVYDLQITGTISAAIVTLVLTTLTVKARVPTS